ncbi:MAG TPA: efflux RND transporter periplasmic adaptor subunit [Bacteroidetes bacterium]|nr:efflux RND transporter periplasmic adaptor subunit [Bacteroidota bacterium]
MKPISLFIWIMFVFGVAGCKDRQKNNQGNNNSYYTCPMHTNVRSDKPGSCPVCNMALIEVKEERTQPTNEEGNVVSLDAHKQKVAGIKTDTVRTGDLLSSSSLVGTVVVDEEQVKSISSRAPGRVDKLYVKATGTYLKMGSPLYSIYSEQLQSDQKEYLSVLEKSEETSPPSELINSMLAAARNKLLLWGMTEKQIREIETSGSVGPLVTFYSPISGYVTELSVSEGMYVMEGSPLLKIVALDQVWIETQIYANEISVQDKNKTFLVIAGDRSKNRYTGTLVYNNPIIEEGKRIYKIKIRVKNTDGGLIPGTLVSVIPMDTTSQVITVPKTAVLLENMKTVWVKTGEHTFEQRMVKTGAENAHRIEVVSGLKAGEIIVTEGAYLISSAFILKNGTEQRHQH